jgi:hypothetical protein
MHACFGRMMSQFDSGISDCGVREQANPANCELVYTTGALPVRHSHLSVPPDAGCVFLKRLSLVRL